MGSATEKIWQLFIINPGTLDVENLQAFLKIMKVDPEFKRPFPHGFILAEPIDNNKGGILYPKDTELTTKHMQRLAQLKETNPEYEFKISIKKNKKGVEFFRGQIKRDFNKLIESKKNRQEYRASIGRLEKTVTMYIDDILKDDELIYLLFRGRSIDEVTNKSGMPRHFYHSINVTIFCLEIIQNAVMTSGSRFGKSDLINIAILGLLHDIGAIENVGVYTEIAVEKRKENYLKETSQSFLAAKSINIENDLINSLKKFAAYHQGEREVIFAGDDIETQYANILITADLMDLQVSGLFEESVPVRTATDNLYVLANNKVLRRGFVDALAKGLKLNDLFDFYRELDRLKKKCLLHKYAAPYPMLGFKSPVLILCSGRRNDCREYATSAKAVNLLKASSGLEPGAYGRCKLLSTELVKFYETHYQDIKENVLLREGAKKNKEEK